MTDTTRQTTCFTVYLVSPLFHFLCNHRTQFDRSICITYCICLRRRMAGTRITCNIRLASVFYCSTDAIVPVHTLPVRYLPCLSINHNKIFKSNPQRKGPKYITSHYITLKYICCSLGEPRKSSSLTQR